MGQNRNEKPTDTGELGPCKKLQPPGSEFVTWNGPELVLLHTGEQGGSLYGRSWTTETGLANLGEGAMVDTAHQHSYSSHSPARLKQGSVSQHTFAPNSREVNRDTVLKRNRPSMAGVTVYLSPQSGTPLLLPICEIGHTLLKREE